MKKVQTCKV